MKKTIVGVAAALLLGGAIAYAQAPGYWGGGGPGSGWGPGMGPGMMGPGWGQGMGPGMMRGYYGPYGNPEYAPGEAISLDQAKEIAKQYTEKYLKGFSVERVLPFTGMRHTMYSVEVKGPKGEVRFLHVNPWGGVMPFANGPYAAQ
jgi:hypothetical protein